MSGRRGKRIPDRAELDAALAEALDAADRAGVKVAVLGGLAMHRYGSPRLTADVDLVADEEVPGLRSLGRLEFDGVDGGQKLQASNRVSVDVLVRQDDYGPLYSEALYHARKIGGVRCVTREHLAAIKYAAGRQKDEDDLDFLIAQRAADLKKVEAIVKRFLGSHTARTWRFFVEESRFRTKSGRR